MNKEMWWHIKEGDTQDEIDFKNDYSDDWYNLLFRAILGIGSMIVFFISAIKNEITIIYIATIMMFSWMILGEVLCQGMENRKLFYKHFIMRDKSKNKRKSKTS